MSDAEQSGLTGFADDESDASPTPAENAEAIGHLADLMEKQVDNTGRILDRLDELDQQEMTDDGIDTEPTYPTDMFL